MIQSISTFIHHRTHPVAGKDAPCKYRFSLSRRRLLNGRFFRLGPWFTFRSDRRFRTGRGIILLGWNRGWRVRWLSVPGGPTFRLASGAVGVKESKRTELNFRKPSGTGGGMQANDAGEDAARFGNFANLGG